MRKRTLTRAATREARKSPLRDGRLWVVAALLMAVLAGFVGLSLPDAVSKARLDAPSPTEIVYDRNGAFLTQVAHGPEKSWLRLLAARESSRAPGARNARARRSPLLRASGRRSAGVGARDLAQPPASRPASRRLDDRDAGRAHAEAQHAAAQAARARQQIRRGDDGARARRASWPRGRAFALSAPCALWRRQPRRGACCALLFR